MIVSHVFATHGDVTRIACDAWLVPTDARRVLEQPWRDALPVELPEPPPGWSDGACRAQLGSPRTHRDPAAWLVNVGAAPGRPVEWYLEGVRAFVNAATGDLKGTAPLHGRARHLLALPLVGTRTGGATHIKGDVVAALLGELQRLSRAHDVDVVLVLWTPAAFAAAQAVRRAVAEREPDDRLAEAMGLTRGLVAEARRLAALAESGRLVLFVGAGVSAGAGLPLWNEMLERIAVGTGLPESELPAFNHLDPLDRARVLEGRLQRQGVSLRQRVVDIFTGCRPSLSHTLLASLPVNEIATTNYDELFERACESARHPVAVLPYESARVRPRWLLKMHGCVSRPADIVLTRDDYLRYGERRAALAGIVQALLVTRHILFVGFSLNDDNFHRLVHDVRQALGTSAGAVADTDTDTHEFGTALLLGQQSFLRELWEGDVRMLPMLEHVDDERMVAAAAHRLEVFLDLVTMLSTSSAAHLLDPTFDGVLTDDERRIRQGLKTLRDGLNETALQSPAWARIQRFLAGLGSDQDV